MLVSDDGQATYIFKLDIAIGNRDGKVLKGQILSKRQTIVGQTNSQGRQGSSVRYTDTDVNRDAAILSVLFISLFYKAIRYMSLSAKSNMYVHEWPASTRLAPHLEFAQSKRHLAFLPD